MFKFITNAINKKKEESKKELERRQEYDQMWNNVMEAKKKWLESEKRNA